MGNWSGFMVCTFFGHREVYEDIENNLKSIIVDLIVKENVTEFYVGNQGKFDYLVRKTLAELSEVYNIKYTTVLAYLPQEYEPIEFVSNTILPNGIESVPKRFAIDWRNRWMLKKSKFVVTYVNKIIGGAAKFKELAEKQNKIVININ